MADETVDAQSRATLRTYEQLQARLKETTDPAQVVVLESCLQELRDELGSLAPSS